MNINIKRSVILLLTITLVIGLVPPVSSQSTTTVYYGLDWTVSDSGNVVSDGDDVGVYYDDGSGPTKIYSQAVPDSDNIVIDTANLIQNSPPQDKTVSVWKLDGSGNQDTKVSEADLKVQNLSIAFNPSTVDFTTTSTTDLEITNNYSGSWTAIISETNVGLSASEIAALSPNISVSGSDAVYNATGGNNTVTLDFTSQYSNTTTNYTFEIDSVDLEPNGDTASLTTETSKTGSFEMTTNLSDSNTSETITTTITHTSSNVEFSTTTNHGGVATFSDIPTGTYDWTVETSTPEYDTVTGTDSVSENTTTSNSATLQKQPGSSELTVTPSSSDGSYAGDFTVSISSTSSGYSDSQTVSNGSDAVFSGIPSETYDVTITGNKHFESTRSVSLSFNGTKSITETLTKINATGVRIVDGNTYYQNQVLYFANDSISSGTVYEIVNQSSGQTQQVVSDEDVVQFNTADEGLRTADFVISPNGASNPSISFTLADQNLSFSSEDTDMSVIDTDTEDTTTKFNINSSNRSEYTVELSENFTAPADPDPGDRTEALTDAELNAMFSANSLSFTDGTAELTISGNSKTLNPDFAGLTEDSEYTFEITTKDTNVSADLSVTTFRPQYISDPTVEDADRLISDGGSYWVGQILATPDQFGGPAELYLSQGEDEGEEFQRDISTNKNDIIILFTEEIGAGDYRLTGPGPSGGTVEYEFLTREQTLEVQKGDLNPESDEEESVRNEGLNSTVPLDITSNRAKFDVIVTQENSESDEADDFDNQELVSRLNGATTKQINGEEEVVIENFDQLSDPTIEFQDVTPASYNFKFDVVDTTAETTLSITVESSQDGTAEFNKDFINSGIGDRVKMDITFTGGSDSTQLHIGDKEDLNYELVADVNASFTGDSQEMTVVFDTEKAGDPSVPNSEVLTVSSDSDTSGNIVVQNETQLEPDITLMRSRYPLELYNDDGVVEDQAVLRHQQVSIRDSKFKPIELQRSLSDIRQNPEEFIADSETGTVLTGQNPGIVEFNVPGLRQTLNDDTITPDQFQKGGTLYDKGFRFIVKEKAEDSNLEYMLNPSEMTYNYDEDRNRMLFVINPEKHKSVPKGSSYAPLKKDTTYEAKLELLPDKNDKISEEEDIPIGSLEQSAEFTYEEAEVTYPTYSYDETKTNDGEGYVMLKPQSGVSTKAQTNLPVGSELSVSAKSDIDLVPFAQKSSVTVSEDGTINPQFDFSGLIETLNVESDFPVWEEDTSTYLTERDVIKFKLSTGTFEEETGLITEDAEIIQNGGDPSDLQLDVSVVDQNGEPVPGVEVQFGTEEYGTEFGQVEQLEQSQETGESGEVSFRDESGEYNLIIDNSEYQLVEETVNLSDEDISTTITLKEQTEPDPVSVQVVFKDGENNAVEGQLSFDEQSFRVNSDEVFDLTPGTYTFTASSENFEQDVVKEQVEITESTSRLEFTFSDQNSEEENNEEENNEENQNGSNNNNTDDSSSTDTESQEPQREPGQPGFGVVLTLLTLLSVIAIVNYKQ